MQSNWGSNMQLMHTGYEGIEAIKVQRKRCRYRGMLDLRERRFRKLRGEWRSGHPGTQSGALAVGNAVGGISNSEAIQKNWPYEPAFLQGNSSRWWLRSVIRPEALLRQPRKAARYTWRNCGSDNPVGEGHSVGLRLDDLQQTSITIVAAATVTEELEQFRFQLRNSWRLAVPEREGLCCPRLVRSFSLWGAQQIMLGSMPTSQSCSPNYLKERKLGISRARWKRLREILEGRLQRCHHHCPREVLERLLQLCNHRWKQALRGRSLCKAPHMQWGWHLRELTRRNGGRCGRASKRDMDGRTSRKTQVSVKTLKHILKPHSAHPHPDSRIEATTGNLILHFGHVYWQQTFLSLSCSCLYGLWPILYAVQFMLVRLWLSDSHSTQSIVVVRPCVGSPVST